MELKVATWNIYIFGDRDAKGIAKTIRDNEIDIIGIQEAGIYFDREKKFDIIEKIADELGYNYKFVSALDFRDKDSDREHRMGNAIISKYPIKNVESFSLNPEKVKYDGNPENEPRVALKCNIKAEEKEIVFITTHLQYTNKFKPSDIRKAEIENLLQIVKRQDKPVVLAGDFNSKVETDERELLESELESIEDDSPTWTVIPFDYNGWQVEELEYRVDEIYYSEDFGEISSSTISSKISDHLPVIADLRME